ncbi:MAG TPA: hypothetical protein VMF61_01985 [Candidatus Acidoferrales bacterium]|nr:hypothetical protein [Candidatus Acidoferrales bacterium]
MKRLSVAAALVLAACSGGLASHGAGVMPASPNFQGAPFAKATPPVTAPVTIPYPYTNTSTTQTWASPTSKPKTKTTKETGLTTVKFALDKKTGVYDVLETIKSSLKYTEALNSAITFPQFEGGTAQIILSDNYSFVQGTFTQTGLDTYPESQDSFNFPLKPGRTWSAAAAHLSSYGVVVTGKGAFAQNVSTNEAADGTYTQQNSSSSTKGGTNQDNSASTIAVNAFGPSVYTYSAPAAGFNTLTQSFALPSNGTIAVTSSGKRPIPVKPGTVQVKDWYPGKGGLPKPLYRDNFMVVGSSAMPGSCGKRKGQPATQVVEQFFNADPVQGFVDTYTADYYMASLAKNQFWFACIVENYTNTNYANGLLGTGSWGGPTSKTVGTEVLLATGAKPKADAVAGFPSMHVLEFVPPALAHLRLEALGLRQ